MQSSAPSKNFILARETAHFRNSIIVPVTEAHRYLHNLGGEFTGKTNEIISFATMMDAVAGDSRAFDFIAANSNLSFSDKQCNDLDKIFPHQTQDVSAIESVFYDVIDVVENLLNTLTGLFSGGRENLKKVIIVLSDFVNKLKKTLLDTALKVYMHTKIEMLVKNQSAIRAA